MKQGTGFVRRALSCSSARVAPQITAIERNAPMAKSPNPQLLVFLLIASVLLALGQASEIGLSKSRELRRMALASRSGLITLDETSFNYYVLESPRPYDLVIFFTGNDCKLCITIQNELTEVASTFKQGGALYPSKSENSRNRAVYFITITFTGRSKPIFEQFQMTSLPNLIVSPPKLAALSPAERIQFLKHLTWHITHTDGQVTAQKLLEFVNKNTGRSLEIKESIFNLFLVLFTLVTMGLGAFKLFLLLKPLVLNPNVWFYGSLLIYSICMAGVVYNILHNVSFTNIDRDGNFEWFHSGARSQFGAEGFVMSFSIAFTGLLIVTMGKLYKFLKPRRLEIYIAYFAVLCVTLYIIRFIEDLYKRKSWYGPQFWPPDHYAHGPLSRDQGTSV